MDVSEFIDARYDWLSNPQKMEGKLYFPSDMSSLIESYSTEIQAEELTTIIIEGKPTLFYYYWDSKHDNSPRDRKPVYMSLLIDNHKDKLVEVIHNLLKHNLLDGIAIHGYDKTENAILTNAFISLVANIKFSGKNIDFRRVTTHEVNQWNVDSDISEIKKVYSSEFLHIDDVKSYESTARITDIIEKRMDSKQFTVLSTFPITGHQQKRYALWFTDRLLENYLNVIIDNIDDDPYKIPL